MMGAPIKDEPQFEAFWRAYPRHDDKGHARPAYARALHKADHATIMAGLAAYAFDPRPKYKPLPATWLNGERWLVDDGDDGGFDPVLRAVGLTPDDFR